MRTALLTGLITGCVFAWLNFGHTMSNADFIYMCAAVDLLKHGVLLASPYFPPGYPLVLWSIGFSGLAPLETASLLSALGMALSSGALAYVGRLWHLPPMAAFGLGLLGVTLPDVFQIGCNPHLDALYTGVGLVLLAVAMRSFAGRAHAGLALLAMLCTVVLVSFRYHATLLVLPLAVVLACYRQTRLVGICTLVAAAGAIGYVYWALYVCTGSFSTAAMTQIATGATYRAQGEAGALEIFNDYAAWMQSHPPVTLQTVLDGVRLNWPMFLVRKAVLLGVAVWLLGVTIYRRAALGSFWLVLFIAGYTLAVSPTYFTPRASALPELAGLLLLAAGLGQLLFAPPATGRGKRSRGGTGRAWIDPAAAGAGLLLLCCAGAGYNVYRELELVRSWRSGYQECVTANRAAAKYTAGDRRLLYGSMDLCGWPVDPGNLPSAVYSRWWMDDPALSPALEKLMPKYSPRQVAAGQTLVRAVLVWPHVRYELQDTLLREVAASGGWEEVASGTQAARLFIRR